MEVNKASDTLMSKKRNKTSGKIKKSRIVEAAKDARIAFQQGNYDKAIIALTTTQAKRDIPDEKRKPALAEAYFRRALRYRTTTPDAALRDLQQALDLMPQDALYVYHLGLLHHLLGDLQKAATSYRQALALDPAFERAALPLLLCLQQQGASQDDLSKEGAWGLLSAEQQAALSGAMPADAQGLLAGLSALRSGDTERAAKQFQEVTKGKRTLNAEQAIAYDYLGRFAAAQDNLELAIQRWQQAYDLGRRDEVLSQNLTNAYLIQLEALLAAGQQQQALRLVQTAQARQLEHPRLNEIMAQILLITGYEAAEQGKWQNALDAWQWIQQADGATARALAANIAIAHEKLEHFGAAADAWRDFIKRRGKKPGQANYLTPEQVGRLWSHISRLYAQSGQFEEAVKTLKTALKHDADNTEMNLQLARRLAENDQIDAAHNQVERLLKQHPNHIESLVFKAELDEVAPKGWAFHLTAGIRSWRRVLEADDADYAGLARERLRNLYVEQISYAMYHMPRMAVQVGEDAVALFPDEPMIRTLYIETLRIMRSQPQLIREQIDRIDLTDERALHQLIDQAHIYSDNAEAEELIRRANEHKPLSADFYKGVARCATRRQQLDVADGYFRRAMDLLEDITEQRRIRVEQAHQYYLNDFVDEAKTLLEGVLAEDAGFGPAHVGMARLVFELEADKRKAKQHLRKAEQWAKKHNDPMTAQQANVLRQNIDNPLPSIFPGPMGDLAGLNLDDMPPDLRRILQTMSPAEIQAMMMDVLADMDLEDDDFRD